VGASWPWSDVDRRTVGGRYTAGMDDGEQIASSVDDDGVPDRWQTV